MVHTCARTGTGGNSTMARINPVWIEAKYYRREGDDYICELCPKYCRIKKGEYGKCQARFGGDDMLIAYTYGRVSSLCVDPIEKKPLYHFYPKSKIFSVGGVGCNLHCKHCQNYSISQLGSGKKRTTYESPQELVDLCKSENKDSIAFTYNEPVIWFEYILDVIKCEPKFRYVLVSNGLVNEEPMRELCKVIDAMNIDVKGFTDEFYTEICGTHLENILKSIKVAFEEGVHIELTYLVIPDHNDSDKELKEFVEWVRDELSIDVPVHFTRFHPDNGMDDVPWTPIETLHKALKIGQDAGLRYVYIGNIMTDVGKDTYCPHCGSQVVERMGYLINKDGLDGDRCRSCKEKLYFRN